MAATWVLLAKAYFLGARLIESSKFGVRDVEVPFDITAEFRKDALIRMEEFPGAAPKAPDFSDIKTSNPIVWSAIRDANLAAKTSLNVLILGESGTGKELFARAIHGASGRRGRFVAENCGAIPHGLVESVLFGHVPGSFPDAREHAGLFEQAEGGTLFLDEIGDMPLDSQVKLLRAIQDRVIRRVGAERERRIDVRLLFATNKDLRLEVASGRFREDLFYRINTVIISLPSLRERREDIPILAQHILEQLAKREPTLPVRALGTGANPFLMRQTWPGNVRELERTLISARIFAEGDEITEDDIRRRMLGRKGQKEILGRSLDDGFNLDDVLAEVERHYLLRAKEQAKGNKSEAAGLLGLRNKNKDVANRAERLGIDWQDSKRSGGKS
jgi:DNA-binding NtrC family response regulator